MNMDNFNSEEKLKSNDEAIKQLLVDMAKNQKKSYDNLLKVFVIMISCYTLILISFVIGFFYYESQFEVVDSVTETTTTTTTQEVSGTDSEINNVQGNMYKDNATHNEE